MNQMYEMWDKQDSVAHRMIEGMGKCLPIQDDYWGRRKPSAVVGYLDTKDMLVACKGELPKGYITHLWQRRRLWDLVDIARGLNVRLGCVNKVFDVGIGVTGGERESQRLVGVVYEKIQGELKWRRLCERRLEKGRKLARQARLVEAGLMGGEEVAR